MISEFSGNTADDVWRAGLSRLKEDGHIQRSRSGTTRELMHVAFCISDPQQRWVVSRLPAMNPAFAIAEVVWIMCGRNDAAFLNFWNRQLPKFAGNATKYHGAYGFRLRQHLGFDQLQRAYQALRNNPNSRQVVLQIWDGRVDFPDEQGAAANADIPCNVLAFLKVRDGSLEWMQINRSNDAFLGVPHNFVQFTTIQEVMAGWLGLTLGSYNHLSDSFHLYEDMAAAFTMDNEVIAESNTNSLCLDKDEFDRVFRSFGEYIDQLIMGDISPRRMASIARGSGYKTAYQNLLIIMCAEAARRRKWEQLSKELVLGCTNPLLVQLWTRWQERVRPASAAAP